MPLPKNIIILSKDYRHFSSDELGVISAKQALLAQNQLPILPSLTISTHALLVLYDPKIVRELKILWKKADSKEVRKQISNLLKKINPHRELLSTLERLIEKEHEDRQISITLSPRVSSASSQSLIIPPSTTNILQAVVDSLVIYQKQVFDKNILGKMKTIEDFFPAFLIQFQTKMHKSGIIWTTDPQFAEKHQMIIHSFWGRKEIIDKSPESRDSVVLDKNTGKIISQESKNQMIECESEASGLVWHHLPISRQNQQKLDKKEVLALLKLAKHAHKQLFFPQRIIWTKRDENFYVIDSQEIDALYQKRAEKPIELSKPILSGICMGQGSVRAKVRLIQNDQDYNFLKKTEIAVIKNWPKNKLNDQSCAGIITESSLEPRLFQHWHIPILSGAFGAVEKLKDDQKVLLDSREGIVYC